MSITPEEQHRYDALLTQFPQKVKLQSYPTLTALLAAMDTHPGEWAVKQIVSTRSITGPAITPEPIVSYELYALPFLSPTDQAFMRSTLKRLLTQRLKALKPNHSSTGITPSRSSHTP